MAYTRRNKPGCPLPVEPAVICTQILNVATATDYPIYVPWNDCELVYAYALTTVASDNNSDVALKFELNAASGTSLGTMTITKNSSVGTVTDWTAGTRVRLSADNTSLDAVNIEIDGDASPSGEFMIYMYFEKYMP